MAERRMFHKSVVESDAFLDMPTSAQALYFHIGMNADDDGFINGPRRIARLIGASIEDLQVLIDNRFLLSFANGVAVVKHWRIANSLKNDRAKMPQYPELAAEIYIKDNRSYTDHPDEGAVSLLEHKLRYMESKWNPNGIPVEGKRTEETRTEENRTEENRVEVEAGGFQASDDYSTELSTLEGTAATAAHSRVNVLGGELGKNVVFLSDNQISDLLDKMDLDAFDYYVDKLSTFIIKNDAKVKNHYETILKWWREDSAVKR